MQQRDERAAAREPDGGLAGRVASTNHGDTFGAAELRLGRPGGVEHAHPLVVGEPVDGEAAVLRASRERDCKRGDLVVVLHLQDGRPFPVSSESAVGLPTGRRTAALA